MSVLVFRLHRWCRNCRRYVHRSIFLRDFRERSQIEIRWESSFGIPSASLLPKIEAQVLGGLWRLTADQSFSINFRFARHPRVAATANQPRNKLLESLFLFTIDSPGRCRRFHWRRLPRVTAPDSHLYYGLPCVFASLEKFVITVTDWATCCTIRLRRNFFPSGATS